MEESKKIHKLMNRILVVFRWRMECDSDGCANNFPEG